MIRRTIAVLAAFAVAAIGAVALPAALSPTSAAWTDDATVSAKITTSGWGNTVPPTAPAVIVPGNDDTSISRTDWTITTPKSDNLDFCVSVAIAGANTKSAAWKLRVDLSAPPFNGVSAGSVYYGGSTQVKLTPDGAKALLVSGVAQASGPWNADYNNALLNSAQHLTVKLCVGTAGIPPTANPNWYSVTQTRGATWTDTQACTVFTVTGKVNDLAANPFYFGWTGRVDLTAAKNRITGAGKTLNYVAFSPDPAGGYAFSLSPTATNPIANTYQLTSGRTTPIRGTESVSITACVYSN